MDHLWLTCMAWEMVIGSTLQPIHVVLVGTISGQLVWKGYNTNLSRRLLAHFIWAIVKSGGPYGTGIKH